MSSWKCTECKHDNNGHARYCMKCGHFKGGKIVERKIVKWQCPICKHENADHAKYCMKCGHWLLSENHTARRIENTKTTSVPTVNTYRRYEDEKTISLLLVIELIIIAIISFSIIVSENSVVNSLQFIFMLAFLVHLLFSIVYVVKKMMKISFIAGIKSAAANGAILLFLLLATGITTTDSQVQNEAQYNGVLSEGGNNEQVAAPLNLQYEDLLRNADTKYKNVYVKLTGTVYHLQNGEQRHIMIDVSNDEFEMNAVHIERNEQQQTIILNDKIEILGYVKGTIGTTNVLGQQSAVPSIEVISTKVLND